MAKPRMIRRATHGASAIQPIVAQRTMLAPRPKLGSNRLQIRPFPRLAPHSDRSVNTLHARDETEAALASHAAQDFIIGGVEHGITINLTAGGLRRRARRCQRACTGDDRTGLRRRAGRRRRQRHPRHRAAPRTAVAGRADPSDRVQQRHRGPVAAGGRVRRRQIRPLDAHHAIGVQRHRDLLHPRRRLT